MQEWHMSCVILGKGLLSWHPWLLWLWFHPLSKFNVSVRVCLITQPPPTNKEFNIIFHVLIAQKSFAIFFQIFTFSLHCTNNLVSFHAMIIDITQCMFPLFPKMESFMWEWVEFNHIAIFYLNPSPYAKVYVSSNKKKLSQKA
jgi:hypothetical protein